MTRQPTQQEVIDIDAGNRRAGWCDFSYILNCSVAHDENGTVAWHLILTEPGGQSSWVADGAEALQHRQLVHTKLGLALMRMLANIRDEAICPF